MSALDVASFLSSISSAVGPSPVGCSLKTSAVSSAVSGVVPSAAAAATGCEEEVAPLSDVGVAADVAGVALLGKPVVSVDSAVLSKLDIVRGR